jgi:hypothetical protein
MLGDNNYGDGAPTPSRRGSKSRIKPLLDAGVSLYATLGNHDEDIGEPSEIPLFNMEGLRYLTFEKDRTCRRWPAPA